MIRVNPEQRTVELWVDMAELDILLEAHMDVHQDVFHSGSAFEVAKRSRTQLVAIVRPHVSFSIAITEIVWEYESWCWASNETIGIELAAELQTHFLSRRWLHRRLISPTECSNVEH